MSSITEIPVDRKELQRVYGIDFEARAILDHFANRAGNQNISLVRVLRRNVRNDGVEISNEQTIRVIRELERLGCGEFKVGRKGYESRFEWRVSSKSVGQVAAGAVKEIEENILETDESDDVSSDEMLKHRFQLRPDLAVTISLPADLTMKEAQRLATFLQAIPFAESMAAILPKEDFSDWEK